MASTFRLVHETRTNTHFQRRRPLYYSDQNGFPFSSEELPHYHLEKGDSHAVFQRWAHDKRKCEESNSPAPTISLSHGTTATILQSSPIVGAWKRPLFTGKWEHTTDYEEIVINIQTETLFVDLRIPRSKPIWKWQRLGRNNGATGRIKITRNSRQILETMCDVDLRLYARQHVFGGFSVVALETAGADNMTSERGTTTSKLPVCTRHHCIDWNYIPNKPRPRPNKWYIEGYHDGTGQTCDAPAETNGFLPFHVWKEWSYATDYRGQSYYWERWERIIGDEMGRGLRLAMRKRKNGHSRSDVDGILVVVGVRIFRLFFFTSPLMACYLSSFLSSLHGALAFRVN